MNKINKFIISIIISFLFITTINLLHYSFSKTNYHNLQIKSFAELSGLPSVTRSVNYLEPRFKEYEDYSTKTYPQLKKINYLGFVYE